MSTLDLIYVNSDFGTMVNFEVVIQMSYDEAYEKYTAKAYIGMLLKEARTVIQTFGSTAELPSQFAMTLRDSELDYLLLLLHTSIDALVDGHVYVRVPSKHAINLTSTSDTHKIWRANGIGLNGLVLARMNDEQQVFITLPTFEEAQEEFIIHDYQETGSTR